jgi:NADH-ubiquinone oxidoreductase chain 1
MTEHAAVIFVFFFLAEYASIVLICILTSVLFIGGYLFDFFYIVSFIKFIDFNFYISNIINKEEISFFDPIVEGVFYGLTLGFKTCIMIFTFIWVRASFPRIRFDQLMLFC